MSLLAVMKLLIVASIVLSVLSLAMRANAADVLYLFRNPGLGVRALVSMYVVVPAVALAIVMAFDLHPGVEIALLVLSLSPVPPLLPKKQLKSGGEGAYITGLLVAAALVSLVAMPLGLHLFGSVFGRDVQVSTAGIAKTLAITIVVPLLLGFAGQKLLGARAAKASVAIGRIAMLMLLVGAAVVLVMVAPAMGKLVGGGTLAALVGMIIAGLAAGYLLGGAAPSNRAALALASATRHPGVALGVVGAAFPDEKQALVAILIFVVLNVIVGIPFLKLVHREPAAG
jgi:BASS family bile acid:Na+ symporter